MSDAFLAERDVHFVRDAGFARDARLRRVRGTHRITYHSAAASLITYLIPGLEKYNRNMPNAYAAIRSKTGGCLCFWPFALAFIERT